MDFLPSWLLKINLVDLIFITFTITMVIFSALMNSIEPYLPVSIRQSIRYGKFAYTGKDQDKLVSMMEVPKSWFKHFYLFAAAYSAIAMFLVTFVYLRGMSVPGIVIGFLDLVYGFNRTEKIDSTTTFVAMLLITAQCLRRFYETHFVQIFSAKGKINFSHYMVGYLHYFGTVTAILGAANGFVAGSEVIKPQLTDLSPRHFCSIILFICAWTLQYQSNMILVNMRKGKDGKVVTQKHLMPQGGYFEKVSAPHMYFEILMYVALFGLLYQNVTSLYIVVWVLSNQVHNALMTHKWYQENFKDYPKQRKAIFPNIL
ncbi:polyprenol reductase [Culicoides brevitarsis]|uniref:polyprenol reductase n=1 Tax=Culicoides brevitarsis TaxID=469753 RepID=UPI00307CC7B6